MSLFHSRPVVVQRTYYKPSTMSRIKAMFSPTHQHARPHTAVAAPRRTANRRGVVRQPVRKSHFHHRSAPRGTVVASQRRPGFLASLRPHTRHGAAPSTAARGRHHGKKHDKHDKKHHSHKGSTIAAILALFALNKKHKHDKARRHHRH